MEGTVQRSLPEDFRLIETFAWRRNPGFINLESHLARLERTARVFGIAYDRDEIDAAISVAQGPVPLRTRLTLDLAGVPEVTTTPILAEPETWNARVATERLDPADPWLRFKTSKRERYDKARAELPTGVHEMLYLNTRGEVCEGTIFNVFVRIDNELLTPRLSCGLLPGVFRETMLRRGKAREAVLRLEDLWRGQFFFGNSLRGLCVARLVP